MVQGINATAVLNKHHLLAQSSFSHITYHVLRTAMHDSA